MIVLDDPAWNSAPYEVDEGQLQAFVALYALKITESAATTEFVFTNVRATEQTKTAMVFRNRYEALNTSFLLSIGTETMKTETN